MIHLKRFLPLLLLILLLTLTGCGTTAGLSLYEGGTWDYANVVTLNPEQEAGPQGDEVRQLLADRWAATSGTPVQFETSRTMSGENTVYRFSVKGTDFSQIAAYLSQTNAKATVKQNEDGSVSLMIPLAEAGEQSVILPTDGAFEFKINGAQIISNNATQVKDGQATWTSQDVRERGLQAIEATITPGKPATTNNQNLLLIGGGLLAGLILLGLAYLAGRRGGRRVTATRPIEPLPAARVPTPAPPVQKSAAPPVTPAATRPVEAPKDEPKEPKP